ncbi:MAG TPA: response regulator [Saprospiraceae bacterium]|nr:response regulator [Saprospiraceae bacterium]
MTLEDGLSHRWAYDIQQDTLGFIWIATFDGINRFDGHRFKVYKPYFPKFPYQQTRTIAQVDLHPDGTIWATSKEGVLMEYSAYEDRFHIMELTDRDIYPLKFRKLTNLENTEVLGLLGEQGSNKEWLTSISVDNTIDTIGELNPITFIRKHRINLDNFDAFWIYSDKNYMIIQNRLKQINYILFSEIPGVKIVHHTLPIDSQSRFWYPISDSAFDYIQLPAQIPLHQWQRFSLDNKNNFWFQTNDKRFFRYSILTGNLEDFGSFLFWDYDIGFPFEDKEGIIWIPHFYGVTRLVIQRNHFENYLPQPMDEHNKSTQMLSIYKMKEIDGQVYANAHNEKVYWLDPSTHQLVETDRLMLPTSQTQEHTLIKGLQILKKEKVNIFGNTTSFLNPDDSLLFLTQKSTHGIYQIDLPNQSIIQYIQLSDTSLNVNCILPVEKGFWIGTDNGLYFYDYTTQNVNHYSTKNGLPNNIIYSLIEDGEMIWIGTQYGLCRLNIPTGVTRNFYLENGLSHNEFNTESVLKGSDGKYYFGGLKGVNAFYPEELESSSLPVPPFLHLNRITKYDTKNDKLIDLSLTRVMGREKLLLEPNDRSLVFEFSVNSYVNPPRNKYLYFLEGWENKWVNNTFDGKAAYQYLPSGSYIFRVIAFDPFGNKALNEIEIPVYIPKIWYLRWWAFTLYFVLFTGLFLFIYRIRLRQHLDRQKSIRLQELDAWKTKLYTNITHEFRTPLTVILGLSDEMSRDPEIKTSQNNLRAIDLIHRNGKSLLVLINQLLDLSRLEADKMSLNYIQADIIRYLRYLSGSFISLAAQKNVTLTFYSKEDSFIMDFDPTVLLNIYSNLLSNAIKFTPEGGKIFIRTFNANQIFQMEIQDTGIGIADEYLPFIFERFYQVFKQGKYQNVGTGIGLTLVKEWIKVLGGSISVKSKQNQGSTFTILIPVTNMAPIDSNYDIYENLDERSPTNTSVFNKNKIPKRELPVLLLVEDNPDVAEYITGSLNEMYQVLHATEGQEGIEYAIQYIPDLIVCDLMMPGKDGYYLTEHLKNDIRTSHIPIILLTARADLDSRLKGLNLGADDYLTKPFNKDELMLRLRNLLDQQRRMQSKYFKQNGFENEYLVETYDPENDFLARAKHSIIDRLDDPEFGNVELSKKMSMSESQLNRKVKALTGKTLSIFIRSVRLYEGHNMLKGNQHTVSEVAYAVGFTDPAYFSRTFSKEFGYTPSSLIKK